MNNISISVIIPTFNRKDSLFFTLKSLCQQSLPRSRYEVIIVDDGSEDDTWTVAQQNYPFIVNYLRQDNQGATAARNNGALLSKGDLIVFIDDDVTISPYTLESLISVMEGRSKTLIVGVLLARSTNEIAQNNEALAQILGNSSGFTDDYVHFSECNTELLAVRRDEFFKLGSLKDPTNGRGWPNWDDVEFGFRAHINGYRLLRCTNAIGIHWDYSIADVIVSAQRWQRLGRSAVCLFQMHPGLQPHIPMFFDKTPVAWGIDHPQLVLRKLIRHITSSCLVLSVLEKGFRLSEQVNLPQYIISPLKRWIIGGYIFRGYRQGLRDFGPVSNSLLSVN